MATDVVILNTLTKLDFKKVFFSVISDTTYRTTLENIIDGYSLASITESDVENVIQLFKDSDSSLTFDSSLFVNSIWSQLCNIQIYKNIELIKKSILTIYDNRMTDEVNAGTLMPFEYDTRLADLNVIIQKWIVVSDPYINIDTDELMIKLVKIENEFSHYDIDNSSIIKQFSDNVSLSILKNNMLVSLVGIIGIIYEPILRDIVDSMVFFTMDSTVFDTILDTFIDRTNLQVTPAFKTELKKQLQEDLDDYKSYTGTIAEPLNIELTPESFTTGNVTIDETNVTSNVIIKPEEAVNLISVDSTNNVNVDVKTVEEIVNVDEFNVQAKIIEPQFKVKVNGANCGLSIDKDDAWKVITNDGESAQWETIGNLIGDQFGFLKIVDTLGERANIPLSQRTVGMLVYVKSRDTYYKCEDNNEDIWTVFKQGFYPHRLTRTVIYENVRLGHGDSGSDLRISDIKSTAFTTNNVFQYLDTFAEVEYANLISFKNVGYSQAELRFDGNTHILNPNSVFELPFDGTLRFLVKGTFNFVSAFVTFDTQEEVIKAQCCDPIRHKYEMESIFDPYF